VSDERTPTTPAKPPWNTGDLHFDRSGRLVIQNRALARAIAHALGKDGGLVLHFPSAPPLKTGERRDPPLPVILCPMPNRLCPDSYCGVDALLTGVQPPRRGKR
jgi:hypothetical protein